MFFCAPLGEMRLFDFNVWERTFSAMDNFSTYFFHHQYVLWCFQHITGKPAEFSSHVGLVISILVCSKCSQPWQTLRIAGTGKESHWFCWLQCGGQSAIAGLAWHGNVFKMASNVLTRRCRYSCGYNYSTWSSIQYQWFSCLLDMAKQIKILEIKEIAPDWCTVYDFNTYYVP